MLSILNQLMPRDLFLLYLMKQQKDETKFYIFISFAIQLEEKLLQPQKKVFEDKSKNNNEKLNRKTIGRSRRVAKGGRRGGGPPLCD